MLMRMLAVVLLAGLSLGFAPLPFPKEKKKTGLTPEEIVKSYNGTYRVVSYEYGNAARLRGIAIARATPYTEVTIKDGMWTQVRELNGGRAGLARRYSNNYQIKIDPKKVVSGMTLTYSGNTAPSYFGVIHKVGGRVTVTYGTSGRVVTNPFGPLESGQYRWVLERTK